MIKKLAARTKEQAATALIAAIAELNYAVRTITLDNGTEIHDYASGEALQKVISLLRHLWERGTKENTNGLVRLNRTGFRGCLLA